MPPDHTYNIIFRLTAFMAQLEKQEPELSVSEEASSMPLFDERSDAVYETQLRCEVVKKGAKRRVRCRRVEGAELACQREGSLGLSNVTRFAKLHAQKGGARRGW